MKQKYVEMEFREATLAIIEKANGIIAKYMEMGFKLTLRQLYYQFVARDWIKNKQSEYKRLGSIVNDGRLAGLIDWDAIEDRGRNVNIPAVWSSPGDIIDACASSYQIDLWQDQPTRVEVWIEKEALAGVIEPVCQEWRVPSFACKGYTSQSEMWDSGANRLMRYVRAKQKPVIIHLGDHDPSGLDMTRDIRERLTLFLGRDVEVERIALNMDQIEEFKPPPNPAKPTDARYAEYQRQYGDECWELDALPPDVLAGLIRDAIERRLKPARFASMKARERTEREGLIRIHENYNAVYEYCKQFDNGDEE